jgi:16S rRNA (guanine527-N7)-methyltransferase
MTVDIGSAGQALDVSRETSEKLRDYLALVEKWNPAINLVAPGSLADGWRRHVADSLQLWALAGVRAGHWLDLGSGGGFPGMVIAILARDLAPELRVTLVDSDSRKCVFLKEVARSLALNIEVRKERIKVLAPAEADVVSARAVAPLSDLLGFALRHMRPDGLALFPKGRTAQEEIDAARQRWAFDCEAVQSQTDSEAVILKIRNIRHG